MHLRLAQLRRRSTRTLSKAGRLEVAAVLATLLGGFVLALQVGGAGPYKAVPVDPEASLSPAQRDALHAGAHAENDAYLKAFVAAGRDPGTLSVIEIETYAAVPTTLAGAAAAADLIVEGTVTKVDFAVNPSGGMPLATATLQVGKTLKGSPPANPLTVMQLGGPVAQDGGGAMAELDVDPLLLPGDHAVVLLSWSSEGTYRTVPGTGVVAILPAGWVAVDNGSPNADSINGLTLTDFERMLTASIGSN
jgi:hypothetical protein